MTLPPLRGKVYDPLDALRDRIKTLERRMLDTEDRVKQLSNWREKRKRYTVLRGFRDQAIRRLDALDKLTITETAKVFGVTTARVKRIRRKGHTP